MTFKPCSNSRHVLRMLPCGNILDAKRRAHSAIWVIRIFLNETKWRKSLPHVAFELAMINKALDAQTEFLSELHIQTPSSLMS